jgi:[protein-PII] uridylyltransferase
LFAAAVNRVEARLAERAETYKVRRVRTAVPPAPPTVRFDNAASSNSTLVEVRAPDRVGILYSITKTFADTGLDIRHARVQTLGNEVVDTFYVRTTDGQKVTDPAHQSEVERAILFAVTK